MITLVFGLPGSGKSTLLRTFMKPPYVVVDQLGEMPGRWLVSSLAHARRIDWTARDNRVVWTAPPHWEFFASLRGYTLILDEADMLWPNPSQLQPGRPGGLHPCAALLARHRHFDIHIVAATQRPKQTPPLARDLAGEVYCFAMSGEAGVYMKRYWNIVPPRVPFRWRRWTPDTVDTAARSVLHYVRKP